MELSKAYFEIGEYLASGLYEDESAPLFARKCRGLRRYYENITPPEYHGAPLYPSGRFRPETAVFPHYLTGFTVDGNRLREKSRELTETIDHSVFWTYHSFVPREHTVAGDMYTHSMPHYERILAEGLDHYRVRVEKIEDATLREGLLDLLCGLETYHEHILAYLESVGAEKRLIEALHEVPFKPARNLYEAVVAWNYVLYLDGCDNLGAVAAGLAPYDKGENIDDLLDCLYQNLDDNHGYSMQLGYEVNRLTVPAIRAVKGKRRPMIELFVDEETPDEVWDAAMEGVLSGNGQPAFYNKAAYKALFPKRFPEVKEEDLRQFCGGGCTEMMLAGLSCVGSLDAGINLMVIFERTLHNTLEKAADFEGFYRALVEDIHQDTVRVMRAIALSQKERAKWNPVPMRTLLIDDCIEKEKDYNAGGARYMWSIINFAGMINVIDSLLAVRDLVFEEKAYSPAEFLKLLGENDETLLKKCRRNENAFGRDLDEVNEFARAFSHTVYGFLKEEKPFFGLGFLPASIQFESYARAGKDIGATPDGRRRGEALCDSLAAIFHKDTAGPTALLKSVTSLDLASAIGTPVVNLTIQPDFSPVILRQLIESYMKLGGLQLQITCTSRETLEDAYLHPEEHPDLIVRVGGYSEYFVRLPADLQRVIIDRTIYEN